MSEETIHVENKVTRERIGEYPTVKALRNVTGWGASKVYRLLNTKPQDQRGELWIREGSHYMEKVVVFRGKNQILKPADKEAQYVVTDGAQVYHGPASLEECQAMKKQIGFQTLKTVLWKGQQ